MCAGGVVTKVVKALEISAKVSVCITLFDTNVFFLSTSSSSSTIHSPILANPFLY